MRRIRGSRHLGAFLNIDAVVDGVLPAALNGVVSGLGGFKAEFIADPTDGAASEMKFKGL